MKDPKEVFKEADWKEEESEEGRAVGEQKAQRIPTGYPIPQGRYRMYVEGFNISIEEPYFWVLDYLRYMWGYPKIDKIVDMFAAAENSAFFGVSQQRIGLQQDKVSQYLATIGKMVKELFQLVRELRVLDERLGYYHDSYTTSPSAESAEITLKGIWIDMVEQGAKNPASVYGMAREVQFTTLPDLFFSKHPKRQEDVDEVVDRECAQFNRKVREVLKRKLRTFLAWKEHTFEEMKTRRKFTLKYLRQHYEIIKMYMSWVKPYLKNIQRLHMDLSKMDTADILAAFETSMIEVEILAKKTSGKEIYGGEETTIHQCILINFLFRTRPEMSYQQEGYQRGPIHVGRVMINFRAYAWTDREVELYKKYREMEDFKLMGLIDGAVKAAMDALGDELLMYLEQAGEEVLKREEAKEGAKLPSILTPYTSVFKGFKDLFTSAVPSKAAGPKKPTTNEAFRLSLAKEKAIKATKAGMWNIYHHFKKHHAMLNW
ncbi:hypothetical protein KY361_06010 [Candidatus Woesearchaeota archaeon]|nr:hypothetical protein [Candidatus Woesearchaeota archaeon]